MKPADMTLTIDADTKPLIAALKEAQREMARVDAPGGLFTWLRRLLFGKPLLIVTLHQHPNDVRDSVSVQMQAAFPHHRILILPDMVSYFVQWRPR